MTVNNIPPSTDFLGQTTFRFSIVKLPTTNFFVQGTNIPSVSLPSAPYPNPNVNIPLPGDHIQFDPLVVTFAIDENMKNYIELFNWISGLGFPETTEQHREITKKQKGFGIFSDAELIILDGKHLPNIKFTFIDAFPTNLSEISMQYTDSDIEYRTCTVTFEYQTFQIESLR